MASYARTWLLLAVVAVWAWPSPAAAKVFTVGDSTGWTILNSPNYTTWASGKTFRAGDTLLFKYNKQFHNVLEVTKADYTACKNSSALSEYTTGEDSVPIKTAGHHYFICGVPGHCQLGQRVDILADVGGAPVPAPSDAPSSSPPGSGLPVSPATNASSPSAGSRLPTTLPAVAGAAVAAYAFVLLGI